MSELIIEGKTKQIFSLASRPGFGRFVAKDDITAGDGKKHDVIPNKGRLATTTTCNVFSLLKACGIPVAFEEQEHDTSFVAPLCKMLPYEVIIRREAHGSYLKRSPGLGKGHYFPKLLLEFFLKTSGRKWGRETLICDDPFIKFLTNDHGAIHRLELFDPASSMQSQTPFLSIAPEEAQADKDLIKKMGEMAKRTFLVLEKAWSLLGRTLVDFKVEFGIDTAGNLLLADVIDNDSWRVLENGSYIDKQVYRDGGDLSEVARKYAHVSDLTRQFALPLQQVVVWTGSERDDTKAIDDALLARASVKVEKIVCSVHKQPARALELFHQAVQKVPDSVFIALIGRSNGAGPTLSAQSTVPVITVPAGYREFPDDVWSSLRTPSDVPLLTVLEPANAALAAFNILAARNPWLYMLLRYKLEERL